jgi:serine/threonine protein kinase
MGVVCRATDTGLERTVALKVIAPEVAADPGFRERFVHESRLAAALDHPNVIPVYEAGEHDGTLFLAMRFVDGMDLREAIALADALEPGRAATPCSPTSASSSPCSTPRATASRRPPPRPGRPRPSAAPTT